MKGTPEGIAFCPFCREGYEGAIRCPEHDLALVPAYRIPPSAESAAAADDAPVPLVDLAGGRLLVLAGAAVALVGFLGPHFVDPAGTLASKSGLGAAASSAPVLWLVPAAAALLGSVAVRRGRRRELRRARVALLAIATIMAAVELYVVERMGLFAVGPIPTIAAGFGVPIVLLGAALAATGALLLGRPRRGPKVSVRG